MRHFSAAFLALLISTTTSAQVETYVVELTGDQEVPVVGSAGIGSATVTLDTGTGSVTVSGTYSNLNGNAIAAHIHGTTVGMPARRGRNAGVVVGLNQTGGTSGTISGSATLTAAEVAVVRAGLTYINLHTTAHGGGELRGQIDSVPGSGSPGAAIMSIGGDATGGGTLALSCPPSVGPSVILIGVPLPLGTVLPLPSPPACSPGPVNLGLNFAVPPLVVSAAVVTVRIPAAIASADLAFQCVTVDPAVCVNLSAASRVAIRP